MVRVRTVWVGGGWIMGVRRKERRPGRETYPRGPAWDRKCQHPAPCTHIQFLLDQPKDAVGVRQLHRKDLFSLLFFLFYYGFLNFLFFILDKVYLHSPGYSELICRSLLPLNSQRYICLCAGCLSLGFVAVKKHHDQGNPPPLFLRDGVSV